MKRPRLVYLTVGLISFATASFGQPSIDSIRKASALGQVIGSEVYCGLSYRQEAIEQWINTNVDPSDLGFTAHLNMAVAAEKYEQKDRGQSGKTAHCAAISQSAKHFGFTGN